MATELHWVQASWSGRLAIAARPRGGDWLADELAAWKAAGVDTVVSLLEPNEERDLDLVEERAEANRIGMRFLSIPIEDRNVPVARSRFVLELEKLDRELAEGRNVLVHCRQGVGRTGLVAACLLVGKGMSLGQSLRQLSEVRGVTVPETAGQQHWLEEFAGSLAAAR